MKKSTARLLALLTALLMLFASIGFAEELPEELSAQLPEIEPAVEQELNEEEPEAEEITEELPEMIEELPEETEEAPEEIEEIPEETEEAPEEEELPEEIEEVAEKADEAMYERASRLENNHMYLLVAKTGGQAYAMTANASGENLAGAKVTITDNKIAESEVGSGAVWTAQYNAYDSNLKADTYHFFCADKGVYMERVSNGGMGVNKTVGTDPYFAFAMTEENGYRVLTTWSPNRASQDSSGSGKLVVNIESDGSFSSTAEDSAAEFWIFELGEAAAVEVQSVAITGRNTIAENGTLKLSAAFTPSYATDKNLTWKSSDETVLKVDANGGVTALGAVGASATISVTTSNGKTSGVIITIVAAAQGGGEVESDDDLKDGDEYVIVSNGYALRNNNGTIGAAAVTVEDGIVELPDGADEDQFLWTLQATSAYSGYGDYLLVNNGMAVTRGSSSGSGWGSYGGSSSTVAATLTAVSGIDYHSAWFVKPSSRSITQVSSSTTHSLYYSTTNNAYYTASSAGTSSHDVSLYTLGAPVPSVKLPETAAVAEGKTTTVEASLRHIAAYDSIQWSLTDSSVATLAQNGLAVTVTGVKAGTANLTVKVKVGTVEYTAVTALTVRVPSNGKSLFIATDRHNNNTVVANDVLITLLKTSNEWLISNRGAGIEAVCLGGDNVAGASSQGGATQPYSTSILDEEIISALPDLTAADTFYTHGSHDEAATDLQTAFLGYGSCKPDVDRGDYYIYGVDYYDIITHDTGVEGAAKFLNWASKADPSKPIIMVSHVPLHAQRGDQHAAETWANTINEAVEKYGLDIVFVFGHNHTTEGMGAVYYAKGETLSVQTDSAGGSAWGGGSANGVNIKLGFTYMNGGYMENSNSSAQCTTYTVDKANRVLYIDRFNRSGLVSTKEVKLNSSAPAPTNVTVTFHTNGTTATASVVSGQVPAKPADPSAITESIGLNADIIWTFENWYSDAACTVAFDFTKAITADTDVYAQYSYETYMGDIDRNGKVNGNDATMILQSKVRLYTLDAYQEQVADLSGNGTVGSEDATYVLQTAARILDTKPVTLYKK